MNFSADSRKWLCGNGKVLPRKWLFPRCALRSQFVMAGLVPAIHALQTFGMAWTYILTNRPNGILYIGVTNDLVRRIHEHRVGEVDGFTKRYRLTRLVYFEEHETMPLAIQREKSMKHWPRAWKVRLINERNREWRDLFDEL